MIKYELLQKNRSQNLDQADVDVCFDSAACDVFCTSSTPCFVTRSKGRILDIYDACRLCVTHAVLRRQSFSEWTRRRK